MKKFIARDLMVPISEYATVSEGASLFEAVLALEKAQEEYTRTRYSHRGVLVLGKGERVTGKISQLAFLRALELDAGRSDDGGDIGKFGFSSKAIVDHQERYRAGLADREQMLATAARLKVEDCMQTLSEGEYIDVDTSLDTAAHQLITGMHLSLLVTEGADIVGILRLSDVFAAAFHAMKETEAEDV